MVPGDELATGSVSSPAGMTDSTVSGNPRTLASCVARSSAGRLCQLPSYPTTTPPAAVAGGPGSPVFGSARVEGIVRSSLVPRRVSCARRPGPGRTGPPGRRRPDRGCVGAAEPVATITRFSRAGVAPLVEEPLRLAGTPTRGPLPGLLPSGEPVGVPALQLVEEQGPQLHEVALGPQSRVEGDGPAGAVPLGQQDVGGRPAEQVGEVAGAQLPVDVAACGRENPAERDPLLHQPAEDGKRHGDSP